jgi:hypothetical protein
MGGESLRAMSKRRYNMYIFSRYLDVLLNVVEISLEVLV